MTVSAKVGSFMITGTLSTQQSINVGFQPKAILFWVNGRTNTTDASGRANHQRGFGAATSPTDRRFIASLAQDTPTAMVTNETQGSAACLGITTTADAIDGLLDIQSIDANGFTVIVDDAFTANYIVQYLALGGDEITNATTGQFTAPLAAGQQDVTSLSFQPDCVIFFSSGQTTTNNTVRPDSKITIGAADSSSQFVWAGGSNDGAGTSQAVSYSNSTECIVTMGGAVATLENVAAFLGFLSNGFSVNWQLTTVAVVTFFIAFKGGSIKAGSLLTQTDTTTDIVETLGFSPSAALFVSDTKAESVVDTFSDDDEWSMGAFSSTSQRGAMSTTDDDAAPTAIVSTGISYDEVYQNLNANTGAVEGEMDIKSINSNGFTCIMDDADPSQAFVWYVAWGSTPAAPASIIQPIFSDDEVHGTLFGGQVVR